jgi:hypothetical protein
MKNFLKIGTVVVAAVTAFLTSSCERTSVELPLDTGFSSLSAKMQLFSGDTLYISCVAIPYPIEFKQQSGSVLTVKDSSDLNLALLNPDSIIDFVYPLDVYLRGTTRTVQSIEELLTEVVMCDTATVTCADLDAHMLLFYNALNILTINKYAYSINYPVQLQVNGQLITLNQDSDYLPAIGGNPMQPYNAGLVYPISISQFGQTLILNSDQDVCDFNATLDESCTNKPAHVQFLFNEGSGMPSGCAYFINYPVQATYNGSVVTFQNFADYTALLNSDPNVYQGLSLVYPVAAEKFQNGQSVSFSSDADICQYLSNCN